MTLAYGQVNQTHSISINHGTFGNHLLRLTRRGNYSLIGRCRLVQLAANGTDLDRLFAQGWTLNLVSTGLSRLTLCGELLCRAVICCAVGR